MFHMWTDAYLQCTSATRLSADLHSKRSKCSHSMYVQQSRCTLSYPLKIYWRLKKYKNQQWWSYGRISSDLGSFVSATRYLHVSGQTYGRPIAGQYEVSATATKSRGNLWQAMVCVCFSLRFGDVTVWCHNDIIDGTHKSWYNDPDLLHHACGTTSNSLSSYWCPLRTSLQWKRFNISYSKTSEQRTHWKMGHLSLVERYPASRRFKMYHFYGKINRRQVICLL